jgi:hypothetical protein
MEARAVGNIITDIDDRYVDVDFSKDPLFVHGCTGPGDLDSFDDFAKAYAPLSRSQIIAEAEKTAAEKAGNAQLIVEVKNQRSEGSCVGNAATQGLQVLMARRFGKDRVTLLSAIATYKQIGRSPSSGANVGDSMRKLQLVGTLPLDNEKNKAEFGDQVMPATGYHTRFPPNWENTAKLFRLGEVTVVRDFESLLTALLCGHVVVVGREGHSILYLDVILRNGRLYVLYVNSWGQWGQAAGDFEYGFGLDTENQIRKSAGWAYAMRTAVERN